MTIKSTRRGVLAGMAGGVATATLPSTSPAARATKTVDPLVALEAEYLQAEEAFGAAAVVADEADGERWLGKPDYMPPPAVTVGAYYCSSEAEIRDRCQPNGPDSPSEAQRDRLIAELGQHQATYRAAREKAGLATLDDARDEAMHRSDALLQRIGTMPAVTFDGIAVKLRRLGEEAGAGVIEPSDLIKALVRTSLEALTRLAEGGRS